MHVTENISRNTFRYNISWNIGWKEVILIGSWIAWDVGEWCISPQPYIISFTFNKQRHFSTVLIQSYFFTLFKSNNPMKIWSGLFPNQAMPIASLNHLLYFTCRAVLLGITWSHWTRDKGKFVIVGYRPPNRSHKGRWLYSSAHQRSISIISLV